MAKSLFIRWTFFLWFSLAGLWACSSNDTPAEQQEQPQQVILTDTFKVAQLNITTENSAPIDSKENYVKCTVALKSDKKEWNYSGTGKIRGRGNSTWLWYPKKPFRFKLDEKAEILGLKSEKDWVLLANYRDPSGLMNTFAFTLGEKLNAPFCNHSRYVELTLNNEYIGLYQLTEQIKQGTNRVSIDSKDGLLLSFDADDGPELNPSGTDNFWSAVFSLPICVKSPENASSAQLAAIRTEFAQLETAINNVDYAGVDKLMDVHSFIDYLIIQELVYNVELAAPRSIYLFRDKGGRWTMGPLWDFDAGFDFDWSTMYTGHTYFASYSELVLGTDPLKHTRGYNVSAFFTGLFQHRQFVADYKSRWLEVKTKIMSEVWPITQKYANGINEAMGRNASRWPIDKNYQTETLHLQQWLSNRIGYLNDVIAGYPAGTK